MEIVTGKGVALLGGIILSACLMAGDEEEDPGLPGKIHKLLEMDAIPAIKDPEFVPAPKAKIPDDARVIAVKVGDDARVYDPNILNHHEIVNDVVGGQNVAVAW